MKIGILTFHWAYNYGAVLQAYALQTYLEKQGHCVEIIDYRPVWAKENKGRRFPLHIVEAIDTLDFYLKKRLFKKFCKKHLKLSKKKYKSGDIIDGYDAVITGSDQVFNPDIIAHEGRIDETYLLASVANGIKRIAYAASFGNSTLHQKYTQKFKELLSKFDAISIREQSGVEIVKRLQLKAVAVPDPTILLGDFSAMYQCARKRNLSYILSFAFQPTDEMNKAQTSLKNIFQLPLYHILSLYNFFCGQRGFLNPSPADWIKLISEAKYVVTDSFHSTVFSILCHTSFISFSLSAWGSDWSERIKFLLDKIDLRDRLIEGNVSQDTLFKQSEINWEAVEICLADWRKDGIEFLNNTIL